MKKRLFLIVICILLAASFVGAACAEEVTAAAVSSGTCGENLTWVLENGTLTISGTGPMNDYYYSDSSWDGSYSNLPWEDSKLSIQTVVVNSGVTTIGNYAFYGFHNLTSISLPEGLTSIGSCAFEYCSLLSAIAIPEGVVSISSYVFYRCDSLQSVSLPSTIQTVGSSAFAACSSLSEITYNGTKAQVDAITFSGDAGDICGATWHCNDGDMQGVGPISGSCGENLSWKLEDGTLTISGTGAMDSFGSDAMPWAMRRATIHTVVVENGVTALGSCALEGCSNLRSVSLPDGLTSIGSNALSRCYALEEIAIPDSVTTIGASAFYNCLHLEEVKLPKSLTELGRNVFANSLSLSRVHFSTGITSIPEYCFYFCALTEATIPEGVTYIADSAFGTNKYLKNVGLPSTIQKIEDSAFGYCDYIPDVSYAGTMADAEAIVIGGTNASIGGATWHCTDGEMTGIGPTSGSCGENLTWKIEDRTLTISGTGEMDNYGNTSTPWEMRMYSITSVVVNSGVTTIGCSAFDYLLNLTSVSLPTGLTSIGSDAFFACKGLTQVTIPEGVTTIGSQAFNYCNNLQSIRMPATIETIGDSAFDGCTLLDEVNYAGTLAEAEAIAIESANDPLCEAYWYCTDGASQGIGEFKDKNPTKGTCGENLTWAIKGNTLTISGTGPMSDYTYNVGAPWYTHQSTIQTVVVNSDVTTIGNYAFNNLYGLTSVSLPEGLSSIGEHAFAYCNVLEAITIPEGVSSIGSGAFVGCSQLQNVSLPSTTETIEFYAFEYCSSLTDVYYSGTQAEADEIAFGMSNSPLGGATWHCTDGDCVGIGPTSGTCGENLTWVLADGTLTISGTGAMDNYDHTGGAPWNIRNSLIQSLVVSSGVTTIGDYAFYGNTISSITLPNGLTKIGDEAFFQSSELTTVTIPEGVTQIGAFAFQNSYLLESISLPATIQQIEPSAFAYCNSLQTVFFAGTRAETQKIVFGGSNAPLTGAVWYCSDGNLEGLGPTSGTCGENLTWVLEDGTLTISGTGAMDDFEWETTPWEMRKGAIHSVVVNSGVTTIGNYAFNQCETLSSVSLPEGLTHIGEGAFWNCYMLTSVSIPDSVTSIADEAFFYCFGIQELELPAALTSLGSSAFEGLSYVPSLQIPGGVTFIPDKCFADCGFQEVTLGESVTRIGASAFAQNTNLQSISLPSTMAFIDSDAFNACYSLTDVNYAGTQAMADVIIMGSGNNALKAAQWNCTGTDSGETGGQTCGDNLRWTLSDSGILTITGTGAMTDFASGAAPWYASRSGIFYVAIGDGATSIGKNAFQGCANLVCINLPASVTSVEANAFAGCSSLSIVNDSGTTAHQGTISIGSGNGALTAADWYCSDKQADTAVTGICGEAVYWAMKKDGTITISGKGAMDDFDYYTPWINQVSSIRTVVVNSGVTTIGEHAFYNCTNLTVVTLPEGLTRINMAAFGFCSSLTDITIPEGVTSIGQFAFNENTALEYVSLPSTIRTIENGAFNMCANLAEVSCALTEAEADNIVIGENNDPLSAATWTFLDSPEIPLTVLKLPENLTVIREEAFANVAAGKIVIPATVSSIESRAFADSTRLRVLYFEGSPDTIANDILSGCRSVKISVVKGSTAEAWVSEHGFTIEYHE